MFFSQQHETFPYSFIAASPDNLIALITYKNFDVSIFGSIFALKSIAT